MEGPRPSHLRSFKIEGVFPPPILVKSSPGVRKRGVPCDLEVMCRSVLIGGRRPRVARSRAKQTPDLVSAIGSAPNLKIGRVFWVLEGSLDLEAAILGQYDDCIFFQKIGQNGRPGKREAPQT